ncbi:hypothetical protein BGC33_04740, partial [Bathymodiolus thermophilus thioautotrophic gill symbiont]
VLNSSNLQKARDFFESKAKILLIVSLPQDVFISSGATVKTSLVFFKKFTKAEQGHYQTIKKNSTAEINAKYFDEIETMRESLKLKGNNSKTKDEKKILRKQLKEIEIKTAEAIKVIIKTKFDYQIPIGEIKQAGITTTGKQGDNQLPELLKAFVGYKKQNNLW